MNNLKSSLKKLKEKFPLLFFINGIFLASLIIIVNSIKAKIKDLMLLMQTYAPQLDQIRKVAEQNTFTTNSYNTINQLQSLTQGTLNYLQIYIPLIVLVLFIITQSITWYYIKGKKEAGRFKPFLIKHAIATSIIFLILYITMGTFLQQAPTTKIITYLIATFILFYVLYTFYLTLNHQTTKQTLKRYGTIAIKKSYIFIPLLFPLFVVYGLTILLFWTFFISFTQDNYFLFSPIQLILYLVIVIAFLIWYKIYLQEITLKY